MTDAETASTLARDGRFLEAAVASQSAVLARHVVRLDQMVERVARDSERVRKQIAEGKSYYTLSELKSDAVSLVDLIVKVEALDESLRDAQSSVSAAAAYTSARAAKGRLDDAAGAIESRDPELAALIRERANVHLAAEQAEQEVERAKLAKERAAARVKRNARPLGKVELDVLGGITTTDDIISRSWSQRRNKGIDSLVDRGYLAECVLADSTRTATYSLTPDGVEAKAALI